MPSRALALAGRNLVAGLLLAVLAPGLNAETTTSVPTTANSGVTVRIATPVSVMPRFGFLPVRIRIDNGSPRTGTWQFRFEAGNADSSIGAIDSRIEISAGAGATTETWYYVPLADAAPRFTLGSPPENPPSNNLFRTRQTPPAQTAAAATTTGVEARARGKLLTARVLTTTSPRLQWATRMERGDRPGELIGVATATQPITMSDRLPTGQELPLGFDVDDYTDPASGRLVRRYIYKEIVPDPTGAAPPKSSVWSTLSSSLTAEAGARSALESSGLLQLPPGATETVQVTQITSGTVSGQPAWLTTFRQVGSPRVLPQQTGLSVPAGAVVNLHPSNRPGEVTRTITFVEPFTLVAPAEDAAEPKDRETLAAEARALLMRYGFLQPQGGVTVSDHHPFDPNFAGSEVHGDAVLWFESGPAAVLPEPLFGSLPPGTAAYLIPGETPGQVIRVFAMLREVQSSVPSVAGGSPPGIESEFTMLVTGPGIVGAANVTFTGLLPSTTSLAAPIAVTQPLAAKFRQTLTNAQARGEPNLHAFDPGSVPADWRMWSPYHAVFMTTAEYEAFSPEQRAALRKWVIQGGLLVLEPRIPPGEEMTPLEPRFPPIENRVGLGMMTTPSWSLDDYLAPPQINEDGTAYVKPAEPVEFVGYLQLHTLALSLPAGDSLAPAVRTPGLLTDASQGSGTLAVIILAGFAILAGPINLFYFAPSGRRHRLFLSTPVLALGFAGALAFSILWWDGFGGHGDRAAVVVLMPEEDSAVVFQDQVSRIGMLTSRTFDLDENAVMANLPVEEFDSTGRTAILTRGDGEAGGDWFRTHWGSAQHLRQVLPTIGGVALTSAGGSAPSVQTNLGTELRDFYLVDSVGRSWYAQSVPSGQSVTLSRANIDFWPPIEPSGSKYLGTVFESAAQLEPNRWLARGGSTDRAPVETLGAISWNDDVVYTGLAQSRLPDLGGIAR